MKNNVCATHTQAVRGRQGSPVRCTQIESLGNSARSRGEGTRCRRIDQPERRGLRDYLRE